MAMTGGGSGAIRAGAAYVELLAKDNSLIRALDNAQKRLGAFAKQVATAGAVLSAGGAGILAPIAGLFAAVTDRATTLDRLATQLGTTVESVSQLGYAFEAAGIKQEEFVDVVKSLQQKLFEAADGQDELFVRLGLNARQLATMPLADQLAKIGGALSSITNPSDRAAVALKVLGGQGQKMLRVLGDGGPTLARLTAEADDVGATVTGEMADAAVRIEGAWTKATSAVKYAFQAIGAALLPEVDSIEELASTVVNVARTVRQFIADNRGLVLGVVAAGAALSVAGGALITFGGGLAALGVGVTGVIVAIKFLAAAVGVLISPLGLAAAAIGGIGYVLATQTDAGREATSVIGGELADAYRTLSSTAVDAFGGIMSALRRGDLQGAGEIAMAGLQVAFRQGVATLTGIWNRLTDPLLAPVQQVVNLFREVWATASDVFGAVRDVVSGFVEAVTPVWQAFGDWLSGVWEQVGDTFRSIVGGMFALLSPAIAAIGGIWQAVAPLFEGGFSESVARIRDMWTVAVAGIRKAFVDMIAAVFRQAGMIAEAFGGKELADDLNAAAREASRAGELIEKERDMKIARRAREREDELKAAREKRALELDGAKAATDAAKDALAELLDLEAKLSPLRELRAPKAPKKDDDPAEALAKTVRGLTLSPGDYRAVFAIGDTVAARSLRVGEQTRDAVKEVRKAIEEHPGGAFV